MALKSLAEIAFDAHQTFADEDRKFKHRFNNLSASEMIMFVRIASRVEAETILRLTEKEAP